MKRRQNDWRVGALIALGVITVICLYGWVLTQARDTSKIDDVFAMTAALGIAGLVALGITFID